MKNYPYRIGPSPRVLAFGLGLALLPGLTAFGQATTTQPATQNQNTNEETTKLEAFSVTGSRIKRIDSETPQPVVRITDADFKATGFTTLGDAIRAVPAIAGQSLVSTDAGTSFTPGVSSFNLRGLGNNNTLVLINGRRAAPFASAGFNGFQTVFDFNSIPTAAVESLEVLKDGASAIYGSDAVAGVINVTFKKDYTGFSSELSYGNTLETDSAEKTAFFIFGAQGDRVSVITTFDYQERSGIDGADLAWSDESNGAPYGGFDQRSTSGPIGAVRGITGRPEFPAGTAYFTAPTTNPTVAGATAGIPLYNFQENVGFFPKTRAFGFYTRAAYDFTSNLTGFMDLSFRRSEVTIDAAPAPYVTSQEIGDSPSGTGIFPATNPFNPFGQNILDLRWRLSELGRRVQESVADSPSMVAGLEGTVGNGWSWTGALLYSKNTVNQLSRNTSSDRLVQNALNGVLLNGVVKYANPFGPNDPDIVNYLRINNPNVDEFEVRSADISASGPIFTLAAGDVGLAVGAEVRTEKMKNLGTQLNRDSQIVAGSAGSDTAGDRRLYSYYAEVSVPVIKNDNMSLELQGAVRHEQYSDFGETTKPKLAAVFRPMPQLLLRASYGESFLAPNLAFLHTSSSTSFSANALLDPARPNDPAVQIRQFGGGNPLLQPEETEVTYAGIVVQPFAEARGSIFRELSFGVDYFDFQQTNLLRSLTAAQILANPAYSNLILRNPPVGGQTIGTISGVQTSWQNLGRGEYKGYDMNLRWVLPQTRYGQFRFDVSGTYIDNAESTAATGAIVDADGEYSTPQFRGTATLAWNKGDWAASLFVTYIGHYMDLFQVGEIEAQTIFNPQIAYRGWFNSTITIGARNVLNEDPPRDLSDSKLVNENTNWVEPTFVYVRWSRDW
jgi:iron complex outermembrane recepter protein